MVSIDDIPPPPKDYDRGGGYKSKIDDIPPPPKDYDLGGGYSQPIAEPDSIASGAYKGWKNGRGVLQGIQDAMKSQNDFHEASGEPIYGSAPLAMPASMAPAALMRAASVLQNSAKARVAANTALGAVQGAAHDPGENGSRLKNAAWGAGIGLGTSLLGEGAAKALPVLGAKMTHVAESDADAYANNPELSESIYGQFKNDPDGLARQLRSQIKGNLSDVFDSKSAPLLDARGKLLAGKTVEVNPSQYAGTAAEPELNRVFNLTKSTDVPEATPMPGRMSLTGPQAQRVKKMLQDAADYSSSAAKINPMEYAAKSEADAIAAGNMRKALEGAAPGTNVLNAELGRNARMGEAAKSLFNSNPTRILNNSESIGNTNIRSLQKYLDENTGSNYQELSDALSAGKAINNPDKHMNLLERWLTDPAGRAILKRTKAFAPLLQSPVGPQTGVSESLPNPPAVAQKQQVPPIIGQIMKNPKLLDSIGNPALKGMIQKFISEKSGQTQTNDRGVAGQEQPQQDHTDPKNFIPEDEARRMHQEGN